MERIDEPDSERLVERVHWISHRLAELMDVFEQKLSAEIKGLSMIEVAVIVMLYKNPQIIMRDLSDVLYISKSRITGIIDHLEELGYLRRVMNRKDRRSYALEITEAGKLAQLQHEECEKQACLQFIKAMETCSISEEYLDQTERLLNFMEKR